MDVRYPGFCTTEELWNIRRDNMKRFVDKFLPLINIKPTDKCFDIGEYNPKIKYLSEKLNIKVCQIEKIDFNFDEINENANVIFCLEVLEHLQNPLLFMNRLKQCLSFGGRIYITIPVNQRWLWCDGHYFEIPRKHFEKWILEPLDLKTTKYKRINFIHDWRGFFIGFRPLVKLLKGELTIKDLIRKVAYYKYDFYEIKKKNI